jgi:hypothetical protein
VSIGRTEQANIGKDVGINCNIFSYFAGPNDLAHIGFGSKNSTHILLEVSETNYVLHCLINLIPR